MAHISINNKYRGRSMKDLERKPFDPRTLLYAKSPGAPGPAFGTWESNQVRPNNVTGKLSRKERPSG